VPQQTKRNQRKNNAAKRKRGTRKYLQNIFHFNEMENATAPVAATFCSIASACLELTWLLSAHFPFPIFHPHSHSHPPPSIAPLLFGMSGNGSLAPLFICSDAKTMDSKTISLSKNTSLIKKILGNNRF